MSVTSPAPCAVIAARTSGALATRSTSFWACSRLEHLRPHLVRRVGLEHPSDDGGDLVAAVLEVRGVLLDGALDRADHRRAAQRPDECLLDRFVERVVDAGDLCDALGAARADGQEPGRPWPLIAGPRR